METCVVPRDKRAVGGLASVSTGSGVQMLYLDGQGDMVSRQLKLLYGLQGLAICLVRPPNPPSTTCLADCVQRNDDDKTGCGNSNNTHGPRSYSLSIRSYALDPTMGFELKPRLSPV